MALLPEKGYSGEIPRMSIETLKTRLGNPDLIVVDVRTAGSWEKSKSKIQGAVREEPKEVSDQTGRFPKDKPLVFYCS